MKQNNCYLMGKAICLLVFMLLCTACKAQPFTPNQPIGEAKGVCPGRVTLVRDTAVATWNGKDGHWWDEGNINQALLDKMFDQSIRMLADAKDSRNAWEKMFRYFNRTHGRGNVGYKPGELIAIKINLNNTFETDDRDNDIDQSPQGLMSLLGQLTRMAGVREQDIMVYDASIGFRPRAIPDRIYHPVLAAFPHIRWMSARGSRGVEPADWVDGAIQYTNPDVRLGNALPRAVVEATYIINLALLKGHEISGITAGAKNHFGSIQWPFKEHGNSTVSQFQAEPGAYSALVDLMGCPNLGGKTLLNIIDGIYGMQTNVGAPRADRDSWKNVFDGKWSSCCLMSQDPVAIECVALDLLYAEFGHDLGFSGAPQFPKGSSRNCDNYLREAATGHNARLGDYRPNGVPTGSLGVFEHWNNPREMKYSRNLGKKQGIELIRSTAQTDSQPMKEIVVTGTRHNADIRHLPFTVNVVDRKTLCEQQQTNVLPTLMQQVPGLFVTSRSMMGYGVSTGAAGGINLRGMAGGAGQLLVLIDGHPQYNGVYGHPISDSYQTLMAERVEVLRGPASVLYGSNAMGGVLNIVTRTMPEEGQKTQVNLGAGSYGTFQAEASNQWRKGGFSSTVAAQYIRTDNHRPDMGFEQYGGHVKLGYDVNKYWTLATDIDLTHWNASNPGTVKQPKRENDQWITRGAASLTVENHYEHTSGALSLYDNFGRHKINDGYNANGGTPQTDFFRSRDAVAGVSWYQSAALMEGNRITVGIDYQHIYGRAWYTDRKTGETVTTPKRRMQSAHSHNEEWAGYLDFRQDITRWFTLDAGLRYDHHSTAGGEWVPQLGIVFRPVGTGVLKASAGKGFRNPNTREMYMYGTANHDSLRAERLWNYELAWHQRLGRVSYGANVFYIKGDNMIQTVAGKNINTGEMENYGLELEAQYHVNRHWTVSTNHSLLHMKHPVVAAPDYKGFLGANCNVQKWSVLAGLQYIHGLYAAVGKEEQKDNFCLLHATVNYALSKMISFWMRGENLLAQDYEINLGYPMPHATFMGGVSISL